MAYWLIKSEPFKYAWETMVADGVTHWDGVRNYQAAGNMRAMKKGDKAFFYHSNEGKEIVGIVEVVREFYPDPQEPDSKHFGLVDFKAAKPFKNPVTLAQIKATPALSDMALLRQSRLSVCPVTEAEWMLLCNMGGII